MEVVMVPQLIKPKKEKDGRLTLGRFDEVKWITNNWQSHMFAFPDRYLPEMRELIQNREKGYEGSPELWEREIRIPKNWTLNQYKKLYPEAFENQLRNAKVRNPIFSMPNENGEPSGYYHIRDCTVELNTFDIKRHMGFLGIYSTNSDKKRQTQLFLEEVFA